MKNDVDDADGLALREMLEGRLTRWLHRGSEILEANFGSLIQKVSGLESWHEAGDGALVRNQFSLTFRSSELDRLLFSENPDWHKLEPILTRSELFKKHLSKLLGSPYGTRRSFNTKELCKLLLPRPIQIDGGAKLETKIDSGAVVRNFLGVLASETLDEVTIWPVGGVVVPQTVRLDEHNEFRELSTEEKLHFLRFGMLRGFDSDRIEPNHSRWFGLVHTELHQKFSSQVEPLPDDMTKWWHQRELLLEHLIASLILLTGQRVTHAGGHSFAPSIQFSTSIPAGVSGTSAALAHFSFLNAHQNPTLTSSQINSLRVYWELLKPIGLSKFQKRLRNALHRYYFAQTRAKPEDAMIDMMIAAESLFLETDKSELSYRLSLNAAVWTDGDSAKKLEIFALFRRAYDIRSRIVHGGYVARSDLQEPLEQVRAAMERAIHKAFKFVASSPGKMPDWEKMAFGASLPSSLDLDKT